MLPRDPRTGSDSRDRLGEAAASRAKVDADFSHLFELTARMVDGPIRQIREFIDQLVTETAAIPAYIADEDPNKPPLVIELGLVVAIDDRVVDEAGIEMQRVAALMSEA